MSLSVLQNKRRYVMRKSLDSIPQPILSKTSKANTLPPPSSFLDGFKWSRGERGNLTTQYDRAKGLVVEKRAAKIGLADPVGIVVGELAEAARAVRGRGEEQRGRLEGFWDGHGRLAVREGEEGGEGEGEGEVEEGGEV